MLIHRLHLLLGTVLAGSLFSLVWADPCGMVPPIYTGPVPITRVGLQKTYVFHKDGVESFVIRPGFSGKIDNFGMLIPFPTPPEIRKVGDNIFEHLANAVDPPEVVVDLRIRMMRATAAEGNFSSAESTLSFARDSVTVLKKEAVGMYEVAVLEAGSSEALKAWMDENGYQYPEGMDKVTQEYVDSGWCFVAVKTRVSQKQGVDPQPGMRIVNPQLPAGSVFDGNVQAMGFRFQSDELVVPMRLSAFNEGDNRNVVYLLTDGPRKIRSIPEEYVVRQLPGEQLIKNLTEPLPLRIIGGTEADIPEYQRQGLRQRRDPEAKNGLAQELFTSDLLAVASGQLSLRHEEDEKELLNIGEHFGLRGSELDQAHAQALRKQRRQTAAQGRKLLRDMTLTVVDGDFPREVIANQNLTFAAYQMPRAKNSPEFYEAPQFGPAPKREGIRKVGAIDWNSLDRPCRSVVASWLPLSLTSMLVVGLAVVLLRRGVPTWGLCLAILLLSTPAVARAAPQQQPDLPQLIQLLESSKTAPQAMAGLREMATDPGRRQVIVKTLFQVAAEQQRPLPQRGWAIGALAEIGGQDVDEGLLNLHASDKQPMLVRTWAAAARVSMTQTVNGLIEKANLIQAFPALGRPVGLRIVEQLKQPGEEVSLEKVMEITMKVPQLNTGLAPMILARGAEPLCETMFTAKDQNIRRLAAGYLATLAQQDADSDVADRVIEAIQFDPQADTLPWNGGPLFLPGINWQPEDAKRLVGQLMRWNLWCAESGQLPAMRPIHNNLRSIALARAAGYQPAGFNEGSAAEWLSAWGAAQGREAVEEILKEQGLLESNRYKEVLSGLKKGQPE